jgi:hypothetical protein
VSINTLLYTQDKGVWIITCTDMSLIHTHTYTQATNEAALFWHQWFFIFVHSEKPTLQFQFLFQHNITRFDLLAPSFSWISARKNNNSVWTWEQKMHTKPWRDCEFLFQIASSTRLNCCHVSKTVIFVLIITLQIGKSGHKCIHSHGPQYLGYSKSNLVLKQSVN